MECRTIVAACDIERKNGGTVENFSKTRKSPYYPSPMGAVFANGRPVIEQSGRWNGYRIASWMLNIPYLLWHKKRI